MTEYIIDVDIDKARFSDDGTKIQLVPTVLREIVRCRNCKHYDRMNDDEGMCMVPDDDGDYARWMVDDVGYCYLGERRGE